MIGRNCDNSASKAESNTGRRPAKKRSLRRKIERASFYVLAWLPVFLYSLYLKFVLLEWDGFRIFARQLGRIEVADLTLLEKCLFFKADVFIGGLSIPVLLFVYSLFAPRILREAGICLVCLVCALLLFVQNQSFNGLGTFTSAEMFFSSLQFVSLHPDEFFAYIRPGSLLKLTILVAAVIVSIGAGSSFYLRRSGRFSRSISRGFPYISLVGVLTLSGVVGMLGKAPSSVFHRSVIVTAFSAFLGGETVDTSEFRGLALEQLQAEYRRLSLSPVPQEDLRYFGRAQDYDVLFFVLETTPADFLDFPRDLGWLPTLGMLSDSAFVGARHYSTYPYTNRALFSVFTSLYPSNSKKSFSHQHPSLKTPGLARSLSAVGYYTGVYSPTPLEFEKDNLMFKAMGFEHHIYPQEEESAVDAEPESDYWQEVKKKDRRTLELMKRELRTLIRKDSRYLAVFLPQIAHGPWPDVSFQQNVDDLRTRGKNLLLLQDAWLGEIVSQLKEAGRFAKTIIVVVADHGFRTRVDYPGFSGGAVDDLSFHVPLLISVPGVLERAWEIPWMSSHIDVSPTLLDLLGVRQGRAIEQGVSIWSSGLSGRRLFFFGENYLGADGYGSEGEFFMWNRFFDRVSKSKGLRFDNSYAAQSVTGKQAEAVRMLLGRMTSLQHAIAERYVD